MKRRAFLKACAAAVACGGASCPLPPAAKPKQLFGDGADGPAITYIAGEDIRYGDVLFATWMTDFVMEVSKVSRVPVRYLLGEGPQT